LTGLIIVTGLAAGGFVTTSVSGDTTSFGYDTTLVPDLVSIVVS
jgi:hypothetical protein